jgi:hypothetical protein
VTDPTTEKRLLHIYGQGAWHDAAFVVGDRTALVALRDAIQDAIENLDAAKETSDATSSARVFADDGEGYVAIVVALSDQEAGNSALRLPYHDPIVGDLPGDHPSNMLTPERYRELCKWPTTGKP